MSTLFALDVALLPPPEVRDRAIELNRALPPAESHGLILNADHIPHVTLAQCFVRVGELEPALGKLDELLRQWRPFPVSISGAGRGGNTVWMAVERSAALLELHEQVMTALRGFERQGGTPAAFAGGDGRVGDAMWVGSYRVKSSLGAFTPHITLGHSSQLPPVAPLTFTADTIAACHLGRFCTCREVRRVWTLIES